MLSFPNAKINIGLNIVEKRPDGYHNIETVFYPVQLCDALEFVESTELSLKISGLNIAGEWADNIVIRAFNLIKNQFRIPNLKIHLHKKIPSGAGLGGGSSDAAFMLKMLNENFRLRLTKENLKEFAGKLGADCPFFIENFPAFATGTGNKLNPVEVDLSRYHIIIVKPPFSVSTVEAYRAVKPCKPQNQLPELIKLPIEEWKYYLKNDFESALASKYPEIQEAKSVLYLHEAVYASLSGSGAALFGLFCDPPVGLEHSFPKNYTIYR